MIIFSVNEWFSRKLIVVLVSIYSSSLMIMKGEVYASKDAMLSLGLLMIMSLALSATGT